LFRFYAAALWHKLLLETTTAMTVNLKELAKVGAKARLAAIQEEQAALLAMFPELRDGRARKTVSTTPAPAAAGAKSRKRAPMSAAQKRAVGERMRAYWAAKRAEKSGAAEGADAEGSGSSGSSRKPGRKGRKQGRKK